MATLQRKGTEKVAQVVLDNPVLPPKKKRSQQPRDGLSKKAVSIMQNILDNLAESSSSTQHSQIYSEIASSSSTTMVQALAMCQERFLQEIASEVVTVVAASESSSSSSSSKRSSLITTQHIQTAMKALGMQDILNEAQRIIETRIAMDSSSSDPPLKRKRMQKTKKWTEKEIQEQERLLSLSREKMEHTQNR
jgi:hypothetical protein